MGAGLLATAVVLGLIIALLWFKAPQVPNLVGQTEEMAKELAGNDFKIQVMFATPESVSTLKDAVVEVDAAETSGASMKMADHMTGHEAAPSHESDNSQEAGHSHWGIICRRSSGDFYSMGIPGDGRSFILKTKGGSTSSLARLPKAIPARPLVRDRKSTIFGVIALEAR